MDTFLNRENNVLILKKHVKLPVRDSSAKVLVAYPFFTVI